MSKTLGTLGQQSDYLNDVFWDDVGSITRSWDLSEETGSSGKITYNFSNNTYDENGITSARQSLFEYAFDYITDVTGIQFIETTGYSSFSNNPTDLYIIDNYSGAFAGTQGSISNGHQTNSYGL